MKTMTEGRDSAGKYRFHYDTVFGGEFEDVEASDIDEARGRFWDHHCPDLVRVHMVELPDERDFGRLGRHEERGKGSYESDQERLGHRADSSESKCPKEVVACGGHGELDGEHDLEGPLGTAFRCVKDACLARVRELYQP